MEADVEPDIKAAKWWLAEASMMAAKALTHINGASRRKAGGATTQISDIGVAADLTALTIKEMHISMHAADLENADVDTWNAVEAVLDDAIIAVETWYCEGRGSDTDAAMLKAAVDAIWTVSKKLEMAYVRIQAHA